MRERQREEARGSLLAPGWLRGGVCLKSVLRGEGVHWSSLCLIRRTLVCPRLIVSWAPQSGGPPLHHYTSGHSDSQQQQARRSHRNQDFVRRREEYNHDNKCFGKCIINVKRCSYKQ